MQPKYALNDKKEFIIENYDKAKTFASFLPGIAGIDGIPMWSFYVNRGQAMGSFGVRDRNSTIMEFFPAHTMYKNIERQGFRTFIKLDGKIHEIFSSVSADENIRTMVIDKNTVKVIEDNKTLGLKITVSYFTMPGEKYAAIVRKVEVHNLDKTSKEIEILDGLPQILPYGVTNTDYQAMSNLMKAWFDVFNTENDIAYYKLRASTADSVEISTFEQGNFYLAFSSESKGLITPIFDMDVIFGQNTAFTMADGWDCPVEELSKRRQVPQNKVSGGFAGIKTVISEKDFVLCSVIGNIARVDLINSIKDTFTVEFINEKEKQACQLVDSLVKDTYTKTSADLFNAYIDNSYLDNILRGGYPLVFKSENKNHVYHVFSRKHGDLEREYNFFSLEPAYYSQGNGNFRDVNQNRRNDVLIKPEVEDFNVKQFMSLIQADGYNPLNVKGCTFIFNIDAWSEIEKLVETDKDKIKEILLKKFTPGKLVSYIMENSVSLNVTNEVLVQKVLKNSEVNFEANFGEGYWSDHWTYNMDLVDSYLQIYPDKKEEFLFADNTYRYYYSPVYVYPRSYKYVITNGNVRQIGAINHDVHEDGDNTWLRTKCGKGEVYRTNLYSKLIALALTKFANLDPFSMGIEMEGGKPGWNDAMNGLPGLFGSSLCETAELIRVVDFVIQSSTQYEQNIKLPVEMAELLEKIEKYLDSYNSGVISDFQYWDAAASAKEDYRKKIISGIVGEEKDYSTKEILKIFDKYSAKLQQAMEKALQYGNGVYPTYFTYTASRYEILEGSFNPLNGYQNVKVLEFECNPLPLFLEGPARVMKTIEDEASANELYKAVRESDIFDRKLEMYKTSGSLSEASTEIGRLKAFTPGWLEREAVFLHMEYKYLYALLKAGLYQQYYTDMKTMLVPFMKPEVYGRSTLDNSSFIASSANPDEAVHGRGFVARLSGSTAEMLSMWFVMMAGKEVFSLQNGELTLKLSPILADWLFDEEGKASFNFLGSTLVTYCNPKKLSTFGQDGVAPYKYELTDYAGNTVEFNSSCIIGEYAGRVRSGKIKSIHVYLQ